MNKTIKMIQFLAIGFLTSSVLLAKEPNPCNPYVIQQKTIEASIAQLRNQEIMVKNQRSSPNPQIEARMDMMQVQELEQKISKLTLQLKTVKQQLSDCQSKAAVSSSPTITKPSSTAQEKKEFEGKSGAASSTLTSSNPTLNPNNSSSARSNSTAQEKKEFESKVASAASVPPALTRANSTPLTNKEKSELKSQPLNLPSSTLQEKKESEIKTGAIGTTQTKSNSTLDEKKESESKVASAASAPPALTRANSTPLTNKENAELKPHVKNLPAKSTVDKQKQNAVDVGPQLEALAKELAQKFNGTVSPLSEKSFSRMVGKSMSDYKGDITKVNDMMRNTVVLDKSVIDKAVASLELQKTSNGQAKIKAIKRQLAELDPCGYSGNIIVFQLLKEGSNPPLYVNVEMQINSAEMIYAKEKEEVAKMILGEAKFNQIKSIYKREPGLGHIYYDEYRDLEKTDPVKAAQIAAKSKIYYNYFR